MRIRKSLRGVPPSDLNSFYTLNYIPNQPITCPLNQSPWDVTTPPEQEQEDGDDIILFGTKIGTKRSRNVVPTGLCIREEEHRATNGSGPMGLTENPTSQDKGKGKAVVDDDEANLRKNRVNQGNKGKGKALVIDDEASLRETRASRENKGKGKAIVVFDEASQREKRASKGNKGKEKVDVDVDGASERKTRASRESKGKGKVVDVVDEASPRETRASRKSKGKEKAVVVIDDDDVEKYCAVINNDGWQCGEPVKKGFHVCKRHWQDISPLVGRKRKPPTKTPSSSSRQRGGGDKDQSQTPENEKQQKYFYY